MRLTKLITVLLTLAFSISSFAQDIELFQQFNGQYDYTAIGNTLNIVENGSSGLCSILTSSSATLNLNSNQTVVAAYMYWAGSDTGDFEVELNNIPVSAQRTFSDALDTNRVFFAAFADITTIVQNQGNGLYTVSEFDLTGVINPYCPTGTNFGGWAITIIYQDLSLPLNQLNVYDGLESVPTNLTITLNNLNVLDNAGAKIGFIAWEGDSALAVNEQLSINGNPIGNPPLNPVNNAFNGTNSFTGANNLYNMDIDVYNIQNNINIGDTSATISLTSGQDFVMINNIITVLNSRLPDATARIDTYEVNCDTTLEIELDYTIYNTNSTEALPSNTQIAFYANGTLIGQALTSNTIPINESLSSTVVLQIPDNLGDTINIIVVVDDNGSGVGSVPEISEINNTSNQITIDLLSLPSIQILPDTIGCDQGFDSAIFNLVEIATSNFNTSLLVHFYTNLNDLEQNENEITNPEAYTNTANPQSIYAKIETPPCYEILQFEISVDNCPPHVPEGFSPNNDGPNDWFNIQGLYDVFENHELHIYNRYGTLIFEGDNSNSWNGTINRGLNNHGKIVPVGTYYYILNLNETGYQSLVGWVYVNY
ncbi:hypothetical protein A9Q87_07140 [Flavobacteriales bacterium 34_180_T64]|nr:hypothetical protein A9Q87_07140 [Flavobacteriales bacterium 34_180_T64]